MPRNVATALNIRLYIAKKWGRTRFFPDSKRSSNSIAFPWGLFFALTPIELTAGNPEIGAKVERDKEINALALTVGTGSQLSKEDLSIGIFAGWDILLSKKI